MKLLGKALPPVILILFVISFSLFSSPLVAKAWGGAGFMTQVAAGIQGFFGIFSGNSTDKNVAATTSVATTSEPVQTPQIQKTVVKTIKSELVEAKPNKSEPQITKNQVLSWIKEYTPVAPAVPNTNAQNTYPSYPVMPSFGKDIGVINSEKIENINTSVSAINIRTSYEHTITVSKNGGDYNSITGALNSITDNDATHLYHIKIMPGTYNESIVMKSYVDISGSGKNSTIINATTGTAVTAASNSTLEDVSVKISRSGDVYGVFGEGIYNFLIRDSSISATSTSGYVAGVIAYNGSTNNVMDGVTVDVAVVLGVGSAVVAYESSVIKIYNSNLKVVEYEYIASTNFFGSNNLVIVVRPTETNSKIYIYDSVVTAVNYDPLDVIELATIEEGGAYLEAVNTDFTATSAGNAEGFYLGSWDGVTTSALIDGCNVSVSSDRSEADGGSWGMTSWANDLDVPIIIKDSIFTVSSKNHKSVGILTYTLTPIKIYNSSITASSSVEGFIADAIRLEGVNANVYVQGSRLIGKGGVAATAYGVRVLSGVATLQNNYIFGSTSDLKIESGATVNSSFNTYSTVLNSGTLNNTSSNGTGNLLNSGTVGVGTSSPAAKLAVTQSANTAAGGIWLSASDNTDFRSMYMSTNGVLSFNGGDTAGTLNTATLNSAGAWTSASDRSYKENIVNLDTKYDTFETLAKMEPRFYTMKGTEKPQIGFIAQELKLVVPEVVEGEEGSMGISYGNLVAFAIQAIKDVAVKVEGLFSKQGTKIQTIVTDEICLDDICIGKEQFRTLLDRSGITYTIRQGTSTIPVASPVIQVVPTPEPTVTPQVETSSTTEAVPPASVPTPIPAPVEASTTPEVVTPVEVVPETPAPLPEVSTEQSVQLPVETQ